MVEAYREPALELLRQWHSRAKGAQWHYTHEAQRLQRLHYWLGIPSVVLSAVVGTAIFASMGTDVDILPQVVVGLGSLAAAVIAALHTFLRFSERAEQNRKLAAGYALLRRDMELVRVRWAAEPIDPQVLESLKARLEGLLNSGADVMFSGDPIATGYHSLEESSRSERGS